MFEKKFQFMQKNIGDDKIREEILKLHEEKQIYQNTAKEALRKAYQDRSDAIQRLTTIQRALCSSEDECSLLREQISKLTQQIQVSNTFVYHLVHFDRLETFIEIFV